MMDSLIRKFPAQLKEAIEIGENIVVRLHDHPISKVVMCGMGGSGIGGMYVANLVADECPCPYIINSSYTLPAYVDKNSLVIASSYSGNTEETLSAMQAAMHRGAKVVCVASGGKMLDLAEDRGLDHVAIPSGWPSPRACLGYSLVQQAYILRCLGLIGHNLTTNLRTAADLISFEQDDIMKKAEQIAGLLYGKMPVIYTTDRSEAVAVRWRQQINENSKQLCWHHVIPEMNHNELVGWKQMQENVAVIFLRMKDDLRRNQFRTDLTKQIVSKLTPAVVEIYAKGQSMAEKMMYLTHLGDWLSWYLAGLNNVDASEINVIDYLKSELSKPGI